MVMSRQADILKAARKHFLTKGYAATTIADIRAASGATTGSIYHAFASKEAIAVALVREAISDWSAVTYARATGQDFRSLLEATVEGLIVWGSGDRESFRIMDELRALALRHEGGTQLRDLIDDGRGDARSAFDAAVAAGVVRDLPWPIASALMLGPAYEYLRQGDLVRDAAIETIARTFALAAWAMLRAQDQAGAAGQ
jgi:AcrR family transcriptional regulator